MVVLGSRNRHGRLLVDTEQGHFAGTNFAEVVE